MENQAAWSSGPTGEAITENDDLLSLMRQTAAREQRGRIMITPLACRQCGWDRFEVTSEECYCETCCIPLDLADGEVRVGESTWEFEESALSYRPPSWAFRKPVDITCPAGHDALQAAVVYPLASDGRIRRLSVVLRCPVDGALRLLLDDVRVAQSRT